MAMDPADVDSAADVREHWGEWSYEERAEALESLANATLNQMGYDDDVDLYTEYDEDNDYSAYHDDDGIHLDASLIEDPDPDDAIHHMNHENVHEMNEQDGIDDDTSWMHDEDGDMEFTEDEMNSMDNHSDAGDVARALDNDGAAPPGGVGGGGGGGAPGGVVGGGSEYEGSSDSPPSEDLSMKIDWASGVWVDTTSEDGSMSVDIYYSPMEGW